MMAFIDINDDSGDMSLVMMPNIYGGLQTLLQKGKYIYFEGNMEKEASVLLKNARMI